MNSPYESLPEKSFWKKAVASKSMFDIESLWDPKFRIRPRNKVATFGSCFAQHIGNALKSRGFNWFITETAPESLSRENAKEFNYGIFSSRTGNIYTTSLLRQWTEWALGEREVPEEVWEYNGRFYDPFRPRIEPNGFSSIEELKASQQQTLKSFERCIKESNFFVFTLGLTESWINAEHGYEYPMCPGTVAGDFDENLHKFKNQQFSEILQNLKLAMDLMRRENKSLKFILTVSPVPLTATKSGNHVLVATMESKSILRAVAGQLSGNNRYVDYYPSYEIINSPVFKGVFFEPNQRSVL
ncbi:GSCFA domain-containing protein [Halomonas elongata]|uniref:GSCFA domain-containing protein n=1 Tax=Halomonas elongata TaxID=2746 RepID=UPI00255B3E04|nr:GSCFA domain-containing protein [Halomonas elongata]MDL4861707.1 GSCFA domain-containing protein [Halomonas elongata]